MFPIDGLLPESMELDFIKSYLRIDHDLDDLEIQLFYRAVIDYVRKYIRQPENETMTDVSLCIPILTMIAYCYEYRIPITKISEKQDQLFTSMLDIHRNDIL